MSAALPPARTTRRPSPTLLLAGLVALAVVAGAVRWFTLGTDDDGEASDGGQPRLTALDEAPEAIQLLPEGELHNLAVLGDGVVATYLFDDPSRPFSAYDYDQGREVWSTTELWAPESGLVAAKPLAGTDLLAVRQGATQVIAQREDGAVVDTVELTSPKSSLTTTSAGTPLVWEFTDDGIQVTLLDSFDADDQRWTASGATPVTGERWIEEDGLLTLALDESVSPGVYALGFDLATGEVPSWMTEEVSSFRWLGEDVLVTIAPEGSPLPAPGATVIAGHDFELRSAEGEVLWRQPSTRAFTVLGGEHLLGFTGMAAGAELHAYDPVTGEPRWDAPASVPDATQVTMVDGRVYALAIFPRLAVYEVDPGTGRVMSSETFAEDRGEGQWQIHSAEGKLIAAQSTPSESHLVAIRPGQAEPIWSETYPGVSSVYRVDDVLVGHRDEEKTPSVVFR